MMKKDQFFSEQVKGNVKAEFVLDKDNTPTVIQDGRTNHYKLKFYVDSPSTDIRRVVYKLHPTYYDPIRETRNKSNKFELGTTSYGDYYLTIDVQVGNETVRQQVLLSDLLKETYKDVTNDSIQKALKDIEDN